MSKKRKIIIFCVFIMQCISLFSISTHSESNDISEETFDMVIISPNSFKNEIQPLINHKQSMHLHTFFQTTESIYDNYPGIDSSEKIKYFIKDSIEQYNIKYVLLIGDIEKIPIRKTAVTWEYFGDLVVKDVITDFYYEDIYDKNMNFSSWDTNYNGIFSEVQMITNDMEDNETFHYIDQIDLISDISVGRLPCKTKKEVETTIEKIIEYETETSGSSWFNKIILIGGDTFPNIGEMNEGEYVTDYIASKMKDFQAIKLWTSLKTFSPIKINQAINKGAGFVSYSGHGFSNGFGTSQPNSDSIKHYYTPYILGLFNNNKYPIMYFDACLTASLDYQKFNRNVPCFAWSMVKKPFGGAIASIGSTRIGYGGFVGDPLGAGSPSLHTLFFNSYVPGIYLGDMFIQAKKSYAETICIEGFDDCLTLQEFILIGDPSLKIGGYKK
ncbi:hypothetical protein B6U98_04675 [Thermoplasmatales archaeon ex4572_165]|nr:MAG: hypothetical protein B6U98_04675 [Thermoplasmatales archaeon ex4572_165]